MGRRQSALVNFKVDFVRKLTLDARRNAVALKKERVTKALQDGLNPTPPISSKREFMIITRAQQTVLHTWIVLVIVKQHLVHMGQIDGQTEYLS